MAAEVRFRYFVTHRNNRKDEPRGLFAVNAEGVPLYNVSYDHVEKRWVYNPRVVDYLFFDRTDEAEEVTRERAEQTAHSLGFNLPSEEELKRIVESSTTGTESVNLEWPDEGSAASR
jgi:hypothetical protein